ncbi:hypothetical protein A3F60_04025 [Candidatus Roizmanbacteria bacterium RIFCSPHIGHO2_12_FULL_39_8]|uniref:Uncharacterized protein n=1 Tax=Candidatus Roizmanbacteria bacterium RIFCSPHIGHO2_12_FULL_39_8 TaxID=1802050 RepID=A0A1F7HWW0_9BACT|nr:MAG: hypothetical protein A3F60_04025 [Candidatus Roizmanbacteria bacterium RIFCSPHIGHO2_12_FULL_39_8]
MNILILKKKMIDVEAKLRPHHIILSAYGNIGAGHVTQGYHVEETIRILYKESPLLVRMQPYIEHWRLDLSGKNAHVSTRLVTSIYKKMQEVPLIESLVSFFVRKVHIKPLQRYIDTRITKTAQFFYQKYLKELDNISALRPIVFHTTHSIPAELAILLAQKLEKKHKVYVIEYLPDPSHASGNYAYVTTANSYFKDHIVVVHDKQSVKELAKIRKNREIYPLGTLSNPFLSGIFTLSRKKEQDEVKKEIYLCSGNYRPKFNTIVSQRIKTIQDYIRSKKVEVIVDAMYQKANLDHFTKLKQELGLDFIILSIPKKTKDVLYEAVKQREQLKNDISTQSNVFIGVTGGEQALESNMRDHVIGVLLAHGHEADNTERAVEDGQVIDLRNIGPEKWDELINDAYKKGKPEQRLKFAAFAEVLLF